MITRFYYANNTEVLRGKVCAAKEGQRQEWLESPAPKKAS